MLAAFCAFILADIYRDFKQVRDDVTDHKYQIKALNEKYQKIYDDVYKFAFESYSFAQKDKTLIRGSIR